MMSWQSHRGYFVTGPWQKRPASGGGGTRADRETSQRSGVLLCLREALLNCAAAAETPQRCLSCGALKGPPPSPPGRRYCAS